MDAQEVRHVALGAAIDVWGDGDIDVHGLLHLASVLEDYLINGYQYQSASKTDTPTPVVSATSGMVSVNEESKSPPTGNT